MDCQQALTLLQDILDKEATEIDEQQVREHLEKCRQCFEKFRLEESIQEFLNEKIKVVMVEPSSTGKLESLRLNILTKLDEVDDENDSGSKGFFLNNPIKILIATAALVVLIGVGFLSADFFRHQEYYIPLEQAHWSVNGNTVGDTNTKDNNNLIELIKASYKFNINESANGYSLVGCKKEQIFGIDWEHVIYENNSDYISVFITSDNRYEIPEDLLETKKVVGGIEIYDHNCRGCRLIFHKFSDLIVVTASSNQSIDLLSFVPGQQAI